jgi:hypothetical protein
MNYIQQKPTSTEDENITKIKQETFRDKGRSFCEMHQARKCPEVHNYELVDVNGICYIQPHLDL